MDEQFIFANPHCYIEEQNMSGRKLYCLREKATNRIVIINTMTDKEAKDISNYLREAIAMRDICPAFFTPTSSWKLKDVYVGKMIRKSSSATMHF